MKFYYKIHKDSNIVTIPLRPLQSCINSPAHHLSQVFADILQPFLKTIYIATYIQDNNQLLYRLSTLPPLDKDNTLISSDVAALYPSIPHTEGLEAMTNFVKDNSYFSDIQISCIIKALELVITENYVMWNKKIYKQSSGVAMGTPVAVAYANIFMHWIDQEMSQKALFVWEHIRYIDDNLFVLPKDRIEDLMEISNSILRPQITFTYDKLDRDSDTGLAFLDTQLFISLEGKIELRLYTKKTDKHAYLLPSSYHPAYITQNIPAAVFNRIRRICSKQEWFQADAVLALEWLEDRGYDFQVIKKAIESSTNKVRWDFIKGIEEKRVGLVSAKDKKDEYEIPFIVIYSQNTKQIKKVLKDRQNLLDASFTTTKVKHRLSFRRQRNLMIC